MRIVVNNNENGTIKDTGLVPGVGSINVKNDNTSLLITNDGQNKKVFINSKETQFANTTSGLEINGDCRITNGLILKGQQTQLVRSETGLIFYDENEKTLKYSTGTTGDDIYNLVLVVYFLLLKMLVLLLEMVICLKHIQMVHI